VLDRIREARRNESGFTLIELLIVIVILGVLAGIVVFAVSNFNDEGKASACKTDKKTIETAEEAYYAQQGHVYGTLAQLLAKNYIRELPSSPDYTITVDSTTGAVSSTGSC